MRAVRSTLGRPDVLYIADVDVPVLGPGQVLVRVRAVGLNPGEASIRSGGTGQSVPGDVPARRGERLRLGGDRRR